MVKKIALFHPWIKSKGGAERQVLEIMKESKADIDLYVWVYDKENTFEEFKDFNVKVIAPKFAEKLSRKNVLRGLIFPLGLLKKIPLEKYDLFLVSTSGLAEFITFRNKIKGKTYAVVCTPLREASKRIIKWNLKNRHEGFVKKVTYILAVKIYRFFEKLAWKNLDKVYFISNLSRQRALDRKLVKKEDVSIIYPPVDFSRFEKLKKFKETKSFVYYSRLNPPKRQDVLLEAWKGFVKEYPEYKLFVVGSADNKNYLEKLKSLQSQTKNVEIKVNVPNKELEEILSSSKAGLFLGYEEDFGIVPFEILAAGKHLLAVDEGGYVDLIKDHPKFHKIKEKHDSKEMVKEIEKALKDFAKMKDKKIKNKKIVLNNFGKEINNFLEN
jgi:glycosyltransferase involved in cell wall biosynthesis